MLDQRMTAFDRSFARWRSGRSWLDFFGFINGHFIIALAVELADDAGVPMIREQSEFVGDVDRVHLSPRVDGSIVLYRRPRRYHLMATNGKRKKITLSPFMTVME